MATIQVRVDDDLKTKSDLLFKSLGTDATSAIRMFLTQAIAYNGFPFELRVKSVNDEKYLPLSEDEILNQLGLSRQEAAAGKVKEARRIVKKFKSKVKI